MVTVDYLFYSFHSTCMEKQPTVKLLNYVFFQNFLTRARLCGWLDAPRLDEPFLPAAVMGKLCDELLSVSGVAFSQRFFIEIYFLRELIVLMHPVSHDIFRRLMIGRFLGFLSKLPVGSWARTWKVDTQFPFFTWQDYKSPAYLLPLIGKDVGHTKKLIEKQQEVLSYLFA